jgi:hypothetical protein
LLCQVHRITGIIHLSVGARVVVAEPRRHVLRGSCRVDEPRPLPQVVRVEETRDRHIGLLGVGDPPITVGEGELLELDQGVQILGAVVAHAADVVGLGHLHQGQLGRALRVRRHDDERVVEIAGPQGLDPGRGVRGEVRGPEVSALGFDEGRQLSGEPPVVELGLLGAGDRLE